MRPRHGYRALPIYLMQGGDAVLDMPPGVALEFAPAQPLVFELHFFNSLERTLTAEVRLKAHLSEATTTRAGFFASYNFQINVPSYGTQTVSGHCRLPADALFFRITTHAHRRMTSASVARWRDREVGETLAHSQDWENPSVVDWGPPYLRFATNEELYYSCSYRNDGPGVVTEGQSVENEMCMAIGYYFPALSSTICLDSFAFPR